MACILSFTRDCSDKVGCAAEQPTLSEQLSSVVKEASSNKRLKAISISEKSNKKLLIIQLVLAIITIGMVFFLLAAQQQFPQGANVISNLGEGASIFGCTVFLVAWIGILITLVKQFQGPNRKFDVETEFYT